MTEIQASKAAKQIGELFERAARGESFLITRYGRPYAVISPPPEDAERAAAYRSADRYLTREYPNLFPAEQAD